VGPKPLFSKKEDQKILSQYNAGAKLKELAAEYGVKIGAIRMAFGRAGYKPTGSLYDTVVKNKVIKLLEAGKDYMEIASRTGVSNTSVRNFAIRKGFREKLPDVVDAVTPAIIKEAKRLYTKEGYTSSMLCKQLGIKQVAFSRVIREQPWYEKRRERRSALTAKESKYARNALRAGKFLGEISEELDRCIGSIKRSAKNYGWYEEIYADPRMRSGNYKRLERVLKTKGISRAQHHDYKRMCRIYASCAYRQYAAVIDPTGLGSTKHTHMDHRLSVRHGELHGVDPVIISHPANLCMLPARVNRNKSDKSSISLGQLLWRVEAFEKKHGVFVPDTAAYSHEYSGHYEPALSIAKKLAIG
jgi:hypothetical protein